MELSPELAVQKLYDSIAEPDRWSAGLDALSDSLGVVGCVFLSRDERMAIPHSPSSTGVAGFIDTFMKDEWYKRDQTAARGWPLISAGKRQVITDDDLTSAEERRRSDYYQDFRYRWNMPHWAAVGFTSNNTDRCLTLLRNGGQGEFTSRDMDVLASLTPHLSRVSHLANVVGKTQISASIDVLETMDQAACLLGWSGNVIALNARAEAMLDDEFTVRRSRLTAAHAPSNQGVEELVQKAIYARFSLDARGADIARVLRLNRKPILLQAIPLAANLLGVFAPAVALVLLTDLDVSSSPPKQALRAVWNLTEAEAKLVVGLCEGLSLDETAVRLGISKETARKQLKAAFDKVGVHRQSELVAQVARIPRVRAGKGL